MRIDPYGLTWWDGIRNGLVGIAVGVGVGAAVVYTAPAWLAAGLGIALAGAGGYMTGVNAYAFAAGEDCWTGAPLTEDEIETCGGQLIVDTAAFGLPASKWFRNGAPDDWKWLKMPPKQRWAAERGKITTSAEKFGEVSGLPAAERRIGIRDIDLSQYGTTWGTGASPGLRYGWPYGVTGANTVSTVSSGE